MFGEVHCLTSLALRQMNFCFSFFFLVLFTSLEHTFHSPFCYSPFLFFPFFLHTVCPSFITTFQHHSLIIITMKSPNGSSLSSLVFLTLLLILVIINITWLVTCIPIDKQFVKVCSSRELKQVQEAICSTIVRRDSLPILSQLTARIKSKLNITLSSGYFEFKSSSTLIYESIYFPLYLSC